MLLRDLLRSPRRRGWDNGGKGNKKGISGGKLAATMIIARPYDRWWIRNFRLRRFGQLWLGGCGRESSKVERKIVGTRLVCDGNCEM